MTISKVGPIVKIKGQPARTLKRLEKAHREFNERFLQELLAENPELLPVQEIRPDAGPLICIGREVRVSSGPIDNLYLSTTGYPVVVETKLWRNPQSRREVLSQTLDHVKDIVGKDYEWLSQQFDTYTRRTTPAPSLWESVAALSTSGVNESGFVDRVNSALARGDVIALIVGDGIETGLQKLVSHLCRNSIHLRYSLALVELACYQLSTEDDSLLIVPHIVQEIERIRRAYVQVDLAKGLRDKVVVTTQADTNDAPVDRKRRPSLTEDGFWDKVESEVGSETRNEIRAFTDHLVEQFGLTPDFTTNSLLLKIPVGDGREATVALLGIRGNGGFFNQESMTNSLEKRIDKDNAKRITAEYWQNLNQIDNRFSVTGIRVRNREKVSVPFNELKGKLSQIESTMNNAVSQIQVAFDSMDRERP